MDAGRRVRALTLFATALGSAIAFLDTTVVIVALPAMDEDLGLGLSGQQWVYLAYELSLSAFYLVGGAIGDRFGLRRTFVVGVVLFAAASLLTALAPGEGVLIGGRALQGVDGAVLRTTSLALLRVTWAGQAGRAIGLWTSPTSLATVGGPVLGGIIAQTTSWRWVFLINVPLAAVTVALALAGRARVPGLGAGGRSSPRPPSEKNALERQQRHLALQPARVAYETAVRPDHAVAGEHDRNPVAIHRHADSSCGLRASRPRRELGVGGRLPERDAGQLHQHPLGEGRDTAEIEHEVEGVALALEVLVELAAHAVDLSRRAQHVATGDPGEPLEVLLEVRVERDTKEASVGGGQEQRPDGAVDEVVPHIEQPAARCRLPEAEIEIGGNGHSWDSFLRRRTPEEAAWRAASGLESSTAAIWS